MSVENVEVVRRFNAAASASREQAVAAVAELCDGDIDYYPVRKFPENRPCHGAQEFSEFLSQVWEAYSSSVWEIRDVIAVGDDRVLACLNMRAEGRGTGISLEGDVYQCLWLRHGRFFRVEDHLTLRGALHALGLEGETFEAAGLRAPPNLDLVRSIYAAWERGDFSETEWAHTDIEFLSVGDTPTRGQWRGLVGMAEGWREWLSAWEEFSVKAEQYKEVDDERVLVTVHFGGRGKVSGLEVDQMWTKGASVFHIHGGKVTRLAVYTDCERALAELSLPSEAGSSDT